MKIIRTGDYLDVGENTAQRLLDQILSRPLFAHLATDSDQGPRESPVWFLWEAQAVGLRREKWQKERTKKTG